MDVWGLSNCRSQHITVFTRVSFVLLYVFCRSVMDLLIYYQCKVFWYSLSAWCSYEANRAAESRWSWYSSLILVPQHWVHLCTIGLDSTNERHISYMELTFTNCQFLWSSKWTNLVLCKGCFVFGIIFFSLGVHSPSWCCDCKTKWVSAVRVEWIHTCFTDYITLVC